MSEWASFEKMLGDSAFDASITPEPSNKDSDIEMEESKPRSRSSSESSSASSKSRSSSSGSSGSSRSNSPEKDEVSKKRSRSKSKSKTPEDAPHKKATSQGQEVINIEEDSPVKASSPEHAPSAGNHRNHAPSRRRSGSRERRDHRRPRGRRSRSKGRRSRSRERRHRNGRSHKSPSRRKRSRSHDRKRSRSHSKDRSSQSRTKNRRSRSGSRSRGKTGRRRSRSRSRERHRRSRSRDRDRRRRRPRRRRRRRRNRSRDRRMRPRSGSRSRSPQRKQNEPLSFKEKLKASLMEVQKKAADGKLSLEDFANSTGLAVSSEKPSNLPLNSLNPRQVIAASGGQVTPQQALLQTMAAMHQKAQELTGVAVPKYYNPAAVNPLKYAEQVQKRKLLWGKKDKDKEKPAEEPGAVAGPSSTLCTAPAAATATATAAAAKPSMSSTWRATHFNNDTKAEAKFRKLMGIKDDPAKSAEASKGEEEPDLMMQKQEEIFSRLDQEYEFARMATHTHRGIGLGFTSHVYTYQPKQ